MSQFKYVATSLPSHWHAFLAALILFLHALATVATGHPNLRPAPLATSTAVATSVATSTAPLATSTLAKKPITKAVVTTTPTSSSTEPVVAAPAPIAVTMTPSQVNDEARAALVNILCTTQAGGSFNPISGSGVIVDTRGIILTNAHVGQYFLLNNYGVENNIQCVVRTGDPAQAMYTAELMYLPLEWIEANASQVNAQVKTGTGENDYAFLRITGSTNPSAQLPSSFPALPMTADDPSVGEQMLLAAYPAGFLDGEVIQTNLYISSAITTVQALYTFDDPHNTDVMDVGGTVVSQSGASGGAVVRLADGVLTGIISTDTAGTTTASRELNAITIAHINRSLASEGQGSIAQLLSQNPAQVEANFQANLAPEETQDLEAVLNKQ